MEKTKKPGLAELKRIFDTEVNVVPGRDGVTYYDIDLKIPKLTAAERKKADKTLLDGIDDGHFNSYRMNAYTDLLIKLEQHPQDYDQQASRGRLMVRADVVEKPDNVELLKRMTANDLENLLDYLSLASLAAGVKEAPAAPPKENLEERALGALFAATHVKWKAVTPDTPPGARRVFQTSLPLPKAKSAAFAMGDALNDMSFFNLHPEGRGNVSVPAEGMTLEKIHLLEHADLRTFFTPAQAAAHHH